MDSPARKHSAAVTFVCGQRGTGKTTWIKRQVLELEARLFVFDHMAEFTEVAGADYQHELQDSILFLRRNANGFARSVLVPLEAGPEVFAVACRVPFAIRDLTMVVDEIDTYAGAVRPPSPVEFTRLVNFGRHFGCSLVCASRRPADVSRALTSQARRIVAFRQTEPKDVAYLRSLVGDGASAIPDLPDLHYLAFEGGSVTRGVVEL